MTGYATFGDGTEADCGSYVNDDSTLADNIVNCSSAGLNINASDITLDCQGFSITFNESFNYPLDGDNGINIDGFNNVTIKNCNIKGGFLAGFSIINSSNLSLINNTISDVHRGDGFSAYSLNNSFVSGNVVFNSSGSGFVFYFSSSNLIVNNTAYENNGGEGFFVYQSTNSLVSGNLAYNNSANGFLLDQHSNLSLTNNTAYNNQDGIKLIYVNDSVISGNTAFNSYGSGLSLDITFNNSYNNNSIYGNLGDGFHIDDSSNSFFTDNSVFNNGGNGFYLNGGVGNTFQSSNISNNTYYGFFLVSSQYSNFTGNIISGNAAAYVAPWASASNNAISDNVVSGNVLAGIFINNSNNNILVNNTAPDNNGMAGIFLGNSENNSVLNNSAYITLSGILRNNLFADAASGADVVDSPEGTVIENNSFENLTYGLRIDNSTVNISGNSFRNLVEAVIINTTADVTIRGNGIGNSVVDNVSSVFLVSDAPRDALILLQDLNFSGNFNDFLVTNSTSYPSVLLNRVFVLGNSSSTKMYVCGLGGGAAFPCAHELNITNSAFTSGKIFFNPSNLDGISLGAFRGNILRDLSMDFKSYVTGNPVYDANIIFERNIFDNVSFNMSIYVPPKPVVYILNNTFANESYVFFSFGEFVPVWIASNTFSDIHEQPAISLSFDNDNSVIANNTFINAGNVNGSYFSNFAYGRYSGINFSGCILWTNGVNTVVLTSPEEEKVQFADGASNFIFTLFDDWPGDLSGLGCGENITVYGADCAFLAGLGLSGTCYYNLSDAVIANGYGSNYTWNTTQLTADGVTFSTTPYLAFDNTSKSTTVWAISLEADNATVTGNMFKGGAASPLIIIPTPGLGGRNNKIYLNAFASGTIEVNETDGNSACVNSSGNFYEESIVPPSGDCGQIGDTSGLSVSGSSIRFGRQSSPIQPVNYDIFRNVSGVFTLLATVQSSSSQVSYNWPLGAGTHHVKIVPWINGSRINGTNFAGAFTISKGAAAPAAGGGASVNVPPYIAKEKVVPEEEAPVPTEEVVPAKPKEIPPVPAKPVPPTVQKPAPEKPSWMIPWIITIIIVIVVVVIAYRYYFRKLKYAKRQK
jgi:parallel beta-helix repeat protein